MTTTPATLYRFGDFETNDLHHFLAEIRSHVAELAANTDGAEATYLTAAAENIWSAEENVRKAYIEQDEKNYDPTFEARMFARIHD